MKGHGSRSSEWNGPLAKYLLSVFARMVFMMFVLAVQSLSSWTGVVPILHKVRKVLVCVSPTKSFGWSSFLDPVQGSFLATSRPTSAIQALIRIASRTPFHDPYDFRSHL